MDDFRTISVRGSFLTCPRCFAENDKTSSIEQMRSQMRSGRPDERAALVARCIGCDLEILVVAYGDGRVEAVDISPYDDVQEEAISPDEIPAAPGPKTNEEAISRYEEGLKQFGEGNYQEAYTYWRAAHDWFSIRPDSLGMASGLLSNMGMALSRLHNPTEALTCFERALSGMDQDESPEGYAIVLNNIGGAYLHLGRMVEAEEYHRRAYELHVSKGSEEGLVARERHNLAFAYGKIASQCLRAEELDKAIESVRQAAALYDEPALVKHGSLYFLMLGNLLRRKGDQVRAQLDLEAALGLYQEALHYHETAKAHELLALQDSDRLSEVNRELGRIDQALETMQKSDELLETLSKRPPMSLTMWKKRGRFALALRRVVQRLLALFMGWGSSVRGKKDEL
ncbi:MAG: tetratricopeptide repeat protein [Anaerolineales bacterium]|nr:tetratricopeptide repeat protein [Anaerolineales bacterium]